MIKTLKIFAVKGFFALCLTSLSSYVLAGETIKSGNYAIQVDDYPAWTSPKIPMAELLKPSKLVPQGAHYALIDYQSDLRSNTSEFFYRGVSRIYNQQSIKQLGEFSVMYSDVYQKVILHHIDIYRDDKKISKLSQKDIRINQIEKNANSRILQGFAQVFMPVEGLRVGDVLDIAYTVIGENPIFGDRHRISLDQNWFHTDVDRARYKVLTSTSRPIHVKTYFDAKPFEPSVKDDTKSFDLELFDIPAADYDPTSPAWALKQKYVIFSEYNNWNEVAKWGDKLFRTSNTTQEVKALAKKFKDNSTSAENAVSLALKFVQDDIRYLSMSIGSYSHVPQLPQVVLDRRYGDCKDKTNLFNALVRELGYKATPVLVSTQHRHLIKDRLPGPQAFDHVVSKVEINGNTYWLDSTAIFQPADIKNNYFGLFDYGLELQENTTDFTAIKIQHENINTIDVVQSFEFTKLSEPATLTVKVSYTGQYAVMAKSFFETGQGDKFFDPVLNALTILYPTLLLEQKPTLSVNKQTGAQEVKLVAKIAQPFIYEMKQQSIYFQTPNNTLIDGLTLRATNHKNIPVQLAIPFTLKEKTILNFPETMVFFRAPVDIKLNDPYLSYSRSIRFDDQQAYLENILVNKRDYLMPDEVSGALSLRQKIRSQLVTGLKMTTKKFADSLRQKNQQPQLETSERNDLLFSIRLKGLYLDRADLNEQLLMTYAIKSDTKLDLINEIALNQSLAGIPDKAIRSVEQALLIDPTHVNSISNKGSFLLAKNNLTESRSFLMSALDKNKDHKESIRYLAHVEYALKNYKAAIDLFEQRLRLATTDDEKIFALIWLKLSTDKAQLPFDRYAQEHSSLFGRKQFSSQLLNYVAGKLTEKELTVASQDITNKMTTWRNESELQFYIGQKHLQQNNIDEAKKYFQKVISLNVVDYIETTLARIELEALK